MLTMTLRRLRPLLLAIAVLVLALPATGVAATAGVTTDTGVVQSVGSTQITLRALDGSVVSFAVSPATRVKLNGVPVSLAEIRPGFIASVVHDGGSPARVIRAFGTRATLVTDRGLVTALARTEITLRTPGGSSVSVPLVPSTRFRLLGLPGKRFLARPGALVAVKHPDGGPATVVNVLKRAGA